MAPSRRRYTNTTAVISRISFIDGDKGILRYRGYPIEELAARSNMMEVAYLVLYGSLPTQSQLSVFHEVTSMAVSAARALRTPTSPVCSLVCFHASHADSISASISSYGCPALLLPVVPPLTENGAEPAPYCATPLPRASASQPAAPSPPPIPCPCPYRL